MQARIAGPDSRSVLLRSLSSASKRPRRCSASPDSTSIGAACATINEEPSVPTSPAPTRWTLCSARPRRVITLKSRTAPPNSCPLAATSPRKDRTGLAALRRCGSPATFRIRPGPSIRTRVRSMFGKAENGPSATQLGHAEPPIEAVEIRGGRKGRDLDRRAAAVLPGAAGQRGFADEANRRQPRMPGRLSCFSFAQSIATS